MLVAERDTLMHQIADGLDASPARCRVAEQFPSQIEQLVAVAETASQEEDKYLLRKLFDWNLVRTRSRGSEK